jgi:hypothetical protein
MGTDNTTQGDKIVSVQKGTTGTGFDAPYVADPWDRGLETMAGEPVRGQAPDTGLEGCATWDQVTLHSSSTGRIPITPGDTATAGKWPISGQGIHSAPGGNEKDMGSGLEKGGLPGFEDMGY